MSINYPELSNLIGPSLRRTKFHVFKHIKPILAKFNLAPGQFSILLIVKTYPGQSQIWIAKKAGMERSSLTPVMNHLDRLGLIKRVKNPNNERARSVTITSAGIEALENASVELNKFERELESNFSQSELDSLVRALQKLETFGRTRGTEDTTQ